MPLARSIKIQSKFALARSLSSRDMAAPTPLFIVSLGNPPPYSNTLHSAGHFLLPSVLGTFAPAAGPLTPHPSYRTGRAATDGPHAFFLPSTLMNVTGPAIAAAWRAFLRTVPADLTACARLVLVHDELELELGKVKLRPGGASARGHNGVKSVSQALGGSMGQVVRIGVGIGRPESRDKDVVSAYVLRKITPRERITLEDAVSDVVELLKYLEAGAIRPVPKT